MILAGIGKALDGIALLIAQKGAAYYDFYGFYPESTEALAAFIHEAPDKKEKEGEDSET